MSFKGMSSSGGSGNSYERRSQSQKAKSSSHNKDSHHQHSESAEGSFKLVMVGDSGVGKSCLLEKLMDADSKNNFISTIGVDVKSHIVTLENKNTVKLQVWDTGGQQRYRPVLSSCYRNANGIILVFDVSNAKSFANLPQWLNEICEFSTDKRTPKLLVGNKSDLGEARREVDFDKAKEFAVKNGCLDYVETSAVGITSNVGKAFTRLINVDVAGGGTKH